MGIFSQLLSGFKPEHQSKLTTPLFDLPKYIALCGAPRSGKSEVQRILKEKFHVLPVDDGRSLRDACKALFGLSEEDVTTQEGKKRHTIVCGKTYENRYLLGRLGELIEADFGDDVIPEAAIAYASKRYESHLEAGGALSFGSVRRQQGRVYKAHGGIVIGVRRPGINASYGFDGFDEALVDYWVDNDGTLKDLENDVVALVVRIAYEREVARRHRVIRSAA